MAPIRFEVPDEEFERLCAEVFGEAGELPLIIQVLEEPALIEKVLGEFRSKIEGARMKWSGQPEPKRKRLISKSVRPRCIQLALYRPLDELHNTLDVLSKMIHGDRNLQDALNILEPPAGIWVEVLPPSVNDEGRGFYIHGSHFALCINMIHLWIEIKHPDNANASISTKVKAAPTQRMVDRVIDYYRRNHDDTKADVKLIVYPYWSQNRGLSLDALRKGLESKDILKPAPAKTTLSKYVDEFLKLESRFGAINSGTPLRVVDMIFPLP